MGKKEGKEDQERKIGKLDNKTKEMLRIYRQYTRKYKVQFDKRGSRR